MLFIGIILILFGLLMLINPSIIWRATEQWKSDAADRPSDLYIKSTRFGGIMFIVAGIAALLAATL